MRPRRRKFHWVSSEHGPAAALDHLDRRMREYYSGGATRPPYQQMVDEASATQADAERSLCEAIVRRAPATVLEVGAGSGRLCQRLRAAGFTGEYWGVELSGTVIARNRATYPDENWIAGAVEAVDLPAGRFDVIFAFFVLEHCVYPARVLRRLRGLLRPGGAVLLVFPDFVESGRLASQTLGYVDGRAIERLRRGDVINAVVNLYDSRVRLRRALRRATATPGSFPVNLSPRCLTDAGAPTPDTDAVYIASRREVAAWAREHGLAVSFPAGERGPFREVVLMQLARPGVEAGDGLAFAR
jgi:SAM-dependent methyltransferase